MSAYYVQVFEGRYYNEEEKKNPRIIIFHNDVFLKMNHFCILENLRSIEEKVLFIMEGNIK